MVSGRADDKCNFRDIDAMLEAVRDKLEWFESLHDETHFHVIASSWPYNNDDGIQIQITGGGKKHDGLV